MSTKKKTQAEAAEKKAAKRAKIRKLALVVGLSRARRRRRAA
ncbi:MAG TPA: hypothetical protein VI488_09105 [Candidatus Angelobacter sp.]